MALNTPHKNSNFNMINSGTKTLRDFLCFMSIYIQITFGWQHCWAKNTRRPRILFVRMCCGWRSTQIFYLKSPFWQKCVFSYLFLRLKAQISLRRMMYVQSLTLEGCFHVHILNVYILGAHWKSDFECLGSITDHDLWHQILCKPVRAMWKLEGTYTENGLT